MIRKKIVTKRLVVRPLRLNDYKTWFALFVAGLPQKNRYDRKPLPAKEGALAKFRQRLKQQEKLAEKDECYIYGVFLRKGGVLIGGVDLFVLARENYQMANFGYWIGNRYWGQGYGKEAAKALMTIGFQHLKLNRLEAAINLDNRRSFRLAKSIGMKREGIKKRYIFEYGEWTDQIIFAANPEDIGLRSHKPKCE